MKKPVRIFSAFIALAFFFSPFSAFAETEEPGAAVALNVFAGRLVKTTTSSAVYYIGPDEKRHAFPNANIYFSWYKDFSSVEVITEARLAKYPLGKNVLYRPGSRLVKIAEVPEVYAIEPGGNLRNLPSEAVAVALYGPNWAKKVDDLDISFFFDYNIAGVAEVVDDRAIYPRGTVVNFDSANYLVDRRTDGLFLLRRVTNEAWLANGFDRLERQLMTDNSLREFFEIGLPVTVAESPFACPSCENVMSDRLSVAYLQTKVSPNGKYSVQAPIDWQVTFPSSLNPESQNLLVAVNTDDPLSRVFFVTKHVLSEGETIEDVFAEKAGIVEQADYRYYTGPSQFLNTGYEMVFGDNSTDDMPENSSFIWGRIVQAGDTVYYLQFSGALLTAGIDSDVIELLMRTFTVDQRIPD